MINPIPTVNVADLVRPVCKVTFEDNTTHDVRPASGKVVQLMRATLGESDDPLDRMYRALGMCIPTATEEQILTLPPDAVQHFLSVAAGQIDAVEKLAPNAPTTTGKKRRPSSRTAAGSPPTTSGQ